MAIFRTAAAALFATLLAGVACAQAVIGTGEPGSLTNNLGYVVATVATQRASVDMQVRPCDTPKECLALTGLGEIAFSLTNIQELRAAVSGTKQFEGASHPDLRAVARLIDVRPALFVRGDSGIDDIASLAGKRVPVAYGDQMTERDAVVALLAAGGLSPTDVRGVEFSDMEEAMAAFQAGDADAMMAYVFDLSLVGVDRALGAERGLKAETQMKMLPVPNDPEALSSMTAAFPGATIVITSPLEGRPGFERVRNTRLPGVLQETRTMSFDVLLVASTATDEEVVYKLVSALAANRDAFLVTGDPQYVSFDKGEMATRHERVEYHPGAIRYYNEAGLWTDN